MKHETLWKLFGEPKSFFYFVILAFEVLMDAINIARKASQSLSNCVYPHCSMYFVLYSIILPLKEAFQYPAEKLP